MRISREWATPLTIGAFAIMATTGVLMFFHLDTGLNKEAHEWLGWLLIIAVGLHVIFHWTSFKRYFLSGRTGPLIMGCCLLILAATFFIKKPSEGLPPPVLAMKAVLNAPLSEVAVIAGRSPEELRQSLNAAGIAISANDQRLSDFVKGDRRLEGKSMSIVFAKPAQN